MGALLMSFFSIETWGNLIQLIILILQRDLSIYVVTDFNIVMLFSNICKPLYEKNRFITFRWILNVLLEVR